MVLELLTILMIRGCTSLVHPQIIKIVNSSETVSRRKNLWKQKLLILMFYISLYTLLNATINGFWVISDLDDLRMYILTLYILRSSRSLITQKRLVGEKTYENKSCLSRRFTSNSVIFFSLRIQKWSKAVAKGPKSWKYPMTNIKAKCGIWRGHCGRKIFSLFWSYCHNTSFRWLSEFYSNFH